MFPELSNKNQVLKKLNNSGKTDYLVADDDLTVLPSTLRKLGHLERAVLPEEPFLQYFPNIRVGANGSLSSLHIDKLNPRTGARTTRRNLAMSPIGGVLPYPPIITPDGATYGYDYRLRLADLYTVSGAR
jgi:hypothetical protein